MSLDARYHTAEHIITGVINSVYGGKIIDVHFKGKKVRADYRIDLEEPVESFVEKLSAKVNDIASSDQEVNYEIVPYEEALKIVSLHKVPEKTEEVRLVKIGEFDITPCSGAHVKNTSEIGFIEIRNCWFVEPGILRLTFMLR